jgi:hypothetical protein
MDPALALFCSVVFFILLVCFIGPKALIAILPLSFLVFIVADVSAKEARRRNLDQ